MSIISDLFGGGPKLKLPGPPPSPPQRADPAIAEAARLARRRALKAKGLASTILTDVDVEVLGGEQFPTGGTETKTLLGG